MGWTVMSGVHLCASASAYKPNLVKHRPLRQLRHEIVGDFLSKCQLDSLFFASAMRV